MKLESLTKLSVTAICHGPLPLRQLLEESLYYPACDIDGGVVRYCNERFDMFGICSYVYVDYAAGEGRLREHLDEFRGYHLLASRRLSPSDVGANRPFPMPEGIDSEEYGRYRRDWKPFACWAVYERDANYGSSHGPERFSLLYLGAEGVAAYAGLYLHNNIVPKAIALIQPGHGFGLNWTNFWDWNGPLTQQAKRGKSLPEYFFYGGLGFHGYNDCPWPGYHQIDRVDHYYPDVFDSALTIWRGNIISLKVYDGTRESNYGTTLQILDNPRTLPHELADQVFLEYQGYRYEAKIRTYRCSDTLRGSNTIKELLRLNDWNPGLTFPCEFVSNGDTHIYRILG